MIWKTVIGFDRYEVSSLGEVRSKSESWLWTMACRLAIFGGFKTGNYGDHEHRE
jgi:hypothetical protein